MMSKYDSVDELKIILWYAKEVYYNMDHALEEIVWLIQNVNSTAFDDIIEFYEESKKLKNNKDEQSKI